VKSVKHTGKKGQTSAYSKAILSITTSIKFVVSSILRKLHPNKIILKKEDLYLIIRLALTIWTTINYEIITAFLSDQYYFSRHVLAAI
jgi:hypothetical protein